MEPENDQQRNRVDEQRRVVLHEVRCSRERVSLHSTSRAKNFCDGVRNYFASPMNDAQLICRCSATGT
jgi:hypothetical protein